MVVVLKMRSYKLQALREKHMDAKTFPLLLAVYTYLFVEQNAC
jgi:hypothetical protein